MKCSKCGKEKDNSEFGKRKSRSKIELKYIYRTTCKSCMRESTRKSYYKHIEKRRKAGKIKMKVRREFNNNRVKEIRKSWYERNKPYEFLKANLRHKRTKVSTPKWANKKYMLLWYRFAEIESKRTGKVVHVDHIIPIKHDLVCGLNCEDNMQLLFAEDNYKKSNNFEII